MRNAWLKYTLYRLGLFAGITILLGVLGIAWIIAMILGMMISFAISLLFLSHLRDEISKQIYSKRKKTLGNEDAESDFENEILDNLDDDGKKTPGKAKGK
jgi:hypothetical protein